MKTSTTVAQDLGTWQEEQALHAAVLELIDEYRAGRRACVPYGPVRFTLNSAFFTFHHL